MNKITTKEMRRMPKIILAVVLAALFIALTATASVHQGMQPITGRYIQIENGNPKNVLQKKRLDDWIFKSAGIQVIGKLRKELNLKKIEKQANLNPWVADAEAYIDNNNVLKVKITKRTPIARVFNNAGHSFYLGDSLVKMPVIAANHFNVPVFTSEGNVIFNHKINSQIAYLGVLIKDNKFWNAQIQQIIVHPEGSFVLIPLLGRHQRILFGDTTRAKAKLRNLMAFYKQITPKIGWDCYQKIDLRFKGQIVAKPSLDIKVLKPKEPYFKNKKNNKTH